MRRPFLTFLAAIVFTTTWGQSGTISGKIVDRVTQEPMPFVSVFINNTTIGTSTSDNGEFVLANLSQVGELEVVFSFVGYERKSVRVNYSGKGLALGVVSLTASPTELVSFEVKASRDKSWEKDLKKFEKIFIGQGKLAERCIILNEWVVDFPPQEGAFKAAASEPIEVENRSTGYKITCILNEFSYNRNAFSIRGHFRFEELPTTDEDEKRKWKQNRQTAYVLSRQYLFKSIIDHKINGSGFDLYAEAPGSQNASLRTDLFSAEFGKSIVLYDTSNLVEKTNQEGVYRIKLKGKVEIHNRNGQARSGFYKDVFYPVSWLWVNKASILVTKDGIELNPAEAIFAGAMSNSFVAEMLPLNFQPEKYLKADARKNQALLSDEKIYVHLDRPYYRPGDVMWFKGYVKSESNTPSDSLSQTAYAEVIDNQKLKIVLTQTLRISQGMFVGDIILPDTIRSGEYFLRAYTSWNRNFGEENLYTKPLLILRNSELLEDNNPDISNSKDNLVVIRPDKVVYSRNEMIGLDVEVRSKDGDPSEANLSMSVTDASLISPLRLPTGEDDVPSATRFASIKTDQFHIEKGVSFTGRVLSKGKPVRTSLSIFRVRNRDFFISQSDAQGIFKLNGLAFYDTADFLIQSSKKNIVIDNVESLDLSMRPKIKPYAFPKVKIDGDGTFKLPKEAELGQAKVLKEVVVTKKREEQQRWSYGKPDYVLQAKDINKSYGNLLLTLSGKFPGLIVRQATGAGQETRWIVYEASAGTSSITFPKEVLVMINDVAMTGSPADILSSIDVTTIELIALKRGLSPLNGSYGGSGILFIYTRTSPLPTDLRKEKTGTTQYSMKLPGYHRPTRFFSPDSSLIDKRSLLFWDPAIVTNGVSGKATVSLQAPGKKGTYRVAIEGVTKAGELVKGECIINVKGN